MEHREKTTAPPQKLIVLLAFDKGEDGELIPAFEAREMRDEGTAVRTAKDLAAPRRCHYLVADGRIWSTASLASRWCCSSMATCRNWNESHS